MTDHCLLKYAEKLHSGMEGKFNLGDTKFSNFTCNSVEGRFFCRSQNIFCVAIQILQSHYELLALHAEELRVRVNVMVGVKG